MKITQDAVKAQVQAMYDAPGPSPSCEDLARVVGREDDDRFLDDLFEALCSGEDAATALYELHVLRTYDSFTNHSDHRGAVELTCSATGATPELVSSLTARRLFR